MTTICQTQNDHVLCNLPVKLTVGRLKSLLEGGEAESKKQIVDFIYHRLHERYIEPLLHVPCNYKSGFLMMASACLLIETMQAFYSGRNETRDENGRGNGEKSFREFFERESNFFPGFADEEVDFYSNIRCGILHQAETKAGFSILRDRGKLLDKAQKSIEANLFLEALERCLKKYVECLRASEDNSDLWKNAVKKLNYICANCIVQPDKQFLKLAKDLEKKHVTGGQPTKPVPTQKQLQDLLRDKFSKAFCLVPDKMKLAHNLHMRFVNSEHQPKTKLFDHVDYFQREENLIIVSQPYYIDIAELKRWTAESGADYVIAQEWGYYYPGHATLFFVEFTPSAKASFDKRLRS